MDREWRGGRERVDKRGKSERGRIGSGEEEGKGWIREGKMKWVWIGSGEEEGKGLFYYRKTYALICN